MEGNTGHICSPQIQFTGSTAPSIHVLSSALWWHPTERCCGARMSQIDQGKEPVNPDAQPCITRPSPHEWKGIHRPQLGHHLGEHSSMKLNHECVGVISQTPRCTWAMGKGSGSVNSTEQLVLVGSGGYYTPFASRYGVSPGRYLVWWCSGWWNKSS